LLKIDDTLLRWQLTFLSEDISFSEQNSDFPLK